MNSLLQTHYFQYVYIIRGAVPGCGWHAFIAGSVTLSHFVHPSAAIKSITTVHKSSVWVHFGLDIKPLEKEKKKKDLKAALETEALFKHVDIFLKTDTFISIWASCLPINRDLATSNRCFVRQPPKWRFLDFIFWIPLDTCKN